MKIRHINGVKVCTVKDTLNGFTYAYNYSAVVKAINKIFRESERAEFGGPEHDPMRVALLMIAESCNVKVEKYKTENVVYDDEKIIKKAKEPKLRLPRFTNAAAEYRGLKLITGGISNTADTH